MLPNEAVNVEKDHNSLENFTMKLKFEPKINLREVFEYPSNHRKPPFGGAGKY